jgi:two-component system, chemotaxis family, chemotaxis protein CheY
MPETDKYGALSALVVEDNEHMRLLLKSILRALGVGTVDAVPSAKEAIEFLRTCLPDVLLVDWMMEEMTGIELARHIRNSPDSLNPYIPIIMVTGHGDKETVVAARDAGVNEFLVKPVSARALAERLTSIVDHPRPFVRTKSYFGPDRRRQKLPRKRRERRQGDIDVITPEAIECFVSLVRARMAERPVIRVDKLATGDR